MPRALAILALLTGCTPTGFEVGALLERYTIHRWDGERLGRVALYEAADGHAQVERVELSMGSLAIEQDARMAQDSDGWAYRRRTAQAGAVTWTEVDAQGWRSRSGVSVASRARTAVPSSFHSGRASATQGGWAMGLVHWKPILAALEGSAEGEPLVLDSMNLVSGRMEALTVEVRDRRSLELPDTSIDATRLWAQCAAEGRSLWVANDRILNINEAFGGLGLVMEGLELPDEPAPPLPRGLAEERLVLPTPTARLAGTLTRPEHAETPLPVLILIHGSGGIDRDGNTAGLRHGSFRTLAQLLAHQGLAVLRYDKRGVGGSLIEGEITSTLEDLASDVEAWMDHLAERPDLDGRRIHLAGHSEGGYLAPLVASRDDRVASVVMLAGPVSPLADILTTQLALILEAHGQDEDSIAEARRAQDASIEVIRSGRDRDLPLPLLSEAGSEWFRSHFEHDPAAVLGDLTVPVLAVYGGVDLQVPASEAAALTELRPSTRVITIEDMDHLLMATTTPGLGSYGDPDRPLHPELLIYLRLWFAERALDAPRVPGSG